MQSKGSLKPVMPCLDDPVNKLQGPAGPTAAALTDPDATVELIQVLLQQVTTMRSKGSLKPVIPCLDDPVNKLEGLGEKTRRNLLEVRACAAGLDLGSYVPQECPDRVTTGLLPPHKRILKL